MTIVILQPPSAATREVLRERAPRGLRRDRRRGRLVPRGARAEPRVDDESAFYCGGESPRSHPGLELAEVGELLVFANSLPSAGRDPVRIGKELAAVVGRLYDTQPSRTPEFDVRMLA
jgi:hypothetical protein